MEQIHGNTEGIRKTLLSELAFFYDMETEPDDFASRDMVALLARYSALLNREVAVYLSRGGDVLDVVVGESGQVTLPSLRLRRSEKRLSRVRVLHTHPGGTARLSDVDLNALCQLRLDAICAIGVSPDGTANGLSAAFIAGWTGERPEVEQTPVFPPFRFPRREWMEKIAQLDQLIPDTGETAPQAERAQG